MQYFINGQGIWAIPPCMIIQNPDMAIQGLDAIESTVTDTYTYPHNLP